ICSERRSALRSRAAGQGGRCDARRRKPGFPFSSPCAALRLRSALPHFPAALRLVERALGSRQGFRLAQHFETHSACQRRDFHQWNLNMVREPKTLTRLASEQGARGFDEMVIIISE